LLIHAARPALFVVAGELARAHAAPIKQMKIMARGKRLASLNGITDAGNGHFKFASMIGHQDPGVTAGLSFRHKSTQSIDKIILSGFILKYLFAFYPPG
jgi:hypothetical protein